MTVIAGREGRDVVVPSGTGQDVAVEVLGLEAGAAGAVPPRWRRRYAVVAMCLDVLAALGATLVAITASRSEYGDDLQAFWLVLLIPSVWFVFIGMAGGYEQRFLGIGSEEYRRVLLGALALIGSVATVALVVDLELARRSVLAILPLAGVFTLAGRYAWRKRVHHLRREGRFVSRTLVLGSAAAVGDLVHHLRIASHHGYLVVGVCLTDEAEDGPAIDGIPVVGGVDNVAEGVRQLQADTVAITAGAALTAERVRRLSWSLEPTGANLVIAPALVDVAGPRTSVRPVEGLPLLHVEQPMLSGARRLVKAIYDRVLAALGLVALLPVLAVIGIAIKVDSPGPALYSQRRVGLGGRDFTIYKFRTMGVGAHQERSALASMNEGSGPLFKIRKDPRVTRVGAFLRKTSLDELPQLINVLRGDMSLVGPRPHLTEELELFGEDLNRRLLVKPGITGLWQVSGRSDLTFEESMSVDLRYVENWSLALDLSILWKTAGTVVRGSGAY